MKRKKDENTYYILINLHNLLSSTVVRTLLEVSETTGVHRNTLTGNADGVHGHYLVIPTKIK